MIGVPSFLVPDLLTRDDQWHAASAFWRTLVAEVAREAGVHAEWRSWHPTTFADGVSPIPREFCAVYEGRCDAIRRAVAIEQWAPEDGQGEGGEPGGDGGDHRAPDRPRRIVR
jgi:hypothetical protein